MIYRLPARVDFSKLRNVIRKQTHEQSAGNTSEVLCEFMSLVSNIIAVGQQMNEKELALLTKSLQDWLMKGNEAPRIDPDIRAICIIDLGLTYNPEAAYEHPAVVLEKVNNTDLVLVAPTETNAYTTAFDINSNPTGNKFHMKVDTSNNFAGPCGIELDNIRIVSKSRIVSVVNKIDLPKYLEIKNRLISLYFPKHEEKLNFVSDKLFEDIKYYANGDSKKIEEIKQLVELVVYEYITKDKSK